MSPRMLPFSQVIEQEKRRWMPFRRALLLEDQEAFDRMFECARQPVQAGVGLSRPWGFEAVLMAVLLAHEKRIAGLVTQLKTWSEEGGENPQLLLDEDRRGHGA